MATKTLHPTAFGALLLAACGQQGHEPGPAANSAKDAQVNSEASAATTSACLNSAAYYPQVGGNSRANARLMASMGGGGFKLNGTVADVQSYGVDAAGAHGPTHNARRIITPTGTQYEVELSDMASWDKTFVHIRCTNGDWSDWRQVAK